MKARGLSDYRARCTTPEVISRYYSNLQQVMERYSLLDRPELIYNLDEVGISPEHKPPAVVCRKGTQPQSITSPRSFMVTVIACGNACGNSVPPFFVFPGKRRNMDFLKNASPGTGLAMSDSGIDHVY